VYQRKMSKVINPKVTFSKEVHKREKHIMYKSISTIVALLFVIGHGFCQDLLGQWYITSENEDENQRKTIVLVKEKVVHHLDDQGIEYFKSYRFGENNHLMVVTERDKRGTMNMGTWSQESGDQLIISLDAGPNGEKSETSFTIDYPEDGKMVLTENQSLMGTWYITKVLINENIKRTIYLSKEKIPEHIDNEGDEHFKFYNFLQGNRYYLLRESPKEAGVFPGNWTTKAGNQLTLKTEFGPDKEIVETTFSVEHTENGKVTLTEK